MAMLVVKIVLATMLVSYVGHQASLICSDLQTIKAHQQLNDAQVNCLFDPRCP